MKKPPGVRGKILSFIFFLGVFFLFSQLFSGCFQFRMDEDEVEEYFQNLDIEANLVTYTIEGRNIFYASTGYDSSQMVVFIHGTPGAWTNFINFLVDEALVKKFHLVSIERPGFGNSDFGHAEPSLEVQARLIKPVLEQNKSSKLPIVIGHSIGGPIAAKMVMMYPELIGSVILVAPSIDPDLEPREPWRKLIQLPIIRNMVPIAIRVSNEEILILKEQLTDMLPYWGNIQKPVIVVQGGDDFLVDPGNAAFAQKVLISSPPQLIFRENADHFIPWTAPEIIKEAIEKVD